MRSFPSTVSMNPAELERLARKRAGMRMGWIIHAAAFVAVNLLLAFIALGNGQRWAIFPFLGWGLGLAIHGAVVLLALPGTALMERMVQRERERLAQRDPW
jgi:hypothetical protein